MLIPSNQLTSHSLTSLHTGRSLGAISHPIIDPFKLRVVGFYLQSDPRLLMVDDIREISSGKVALDSEDVLAESEDLLRHQDILDINYQLIGKKAVTRSGEKLGKVDEYVIDNLSWDIAKIHIRQPIWRSLTNGILIVDRQQIVELKDSLVIVEDTVIRSPELAPQQVSS
ncbi:MAG: hypothetical protein WDZ42_00565 [Candidatus Saccharimonadales bacterium]